MLLTKAQCFKRALLISKKADCHACFSPLFRVQQLSLDCKPSNKNNDSIFSHSYTEAARLHRSDNMKTLRLFSTSNEAVKPTAVQKQPISEKRDDDDEEGFFSRHLGKMFGGVILGIALYFYRLSRNRQRKEALEDQLRAGYGAEPHEIEDLREANRRFGPGALRAAGRAARERFPGGAAPYQDFVACAAEGLRSAGVPPLAQGFLLDRVAAQYIRSQPKLLEEAQRGAEPPLPLPVLLAILSLACYSDVEERVEVFHELMAGGDGGGEGEGAPRRRLLSTAAAAEVVGALVHSCQLPAERRVREMEEQRYPWMSYREIKPPEMLDEAFSELKWDAKEKYNTGLTQEELGAVLRSQAVCAWGECWRDPRQR